VPEHAKTPPTEPDVRVTLRPLKSGVPADVRLRRALKCLLRAFGFRCLAVEDVPRPQSRKEP
jgi:hypothetical protein